MDLMAFVPSYETESIPIKSACIVHNCEETEQEDELTKVIEKTKFALRLRRWFLKNRSLSRNHPLTRWCLKSTSAVNYEISRHLRTYPYMIHPFSSFRVFWETIMTVFTFVALLVTPVLVSFYLEEHEKWHALNIVIDATFLSDIAIWFFTGYYDYSTKTIVLDPRVVASKYLKGYFIIDMLPVLPLEFLEYVVKGSMWYCVSLNMLKILRMRTIIIYGRRLRYVSISIKETLTFYWPHVLRVPLPVTGKLANKYVYEIDFQLYKILEMTIVIVISVHWAACLEYFVPLTAAKLFGRNEESWILSSYLHSKRTRITKYLTCLNRGVTALIGSAHYLDMKTSEDIVLNLVLTVIGFLGFIYLLTQFSQLMSAFHSTSKRHYKFIQQLQEYIKYKELPHSLQRRLLIFCNYRNKKGFQRDKEIHKQVSPYLREELLLHNYLSMIDNVELFKTLPRMILTRFATALRSEIFMANDVIVKAGSRGDALYFIASGTVAVYTMTGKEVCHLEDGTYFGEIALVIENEHRTASIVAVETCEIHILLRNDFQRILLPYPDLLKRLRGLALQHLEKMLRLDEAYNFESSSQKSINISTIKGKRRN